MLGTTAMDRFLHLAIYVAGAVALAIAVLALLERVAEPGRPRVVRLVHVAVPIALFVAFGIAERLYHALT